MKDLKRTIGIIASFAGYKFSKNADEIIKKIKDNKFNCIVDGSACYYKDEKEKQIIFCPSHELMMYRDGCTKCGLLVDNRPDVPVYDFYDGKGHNINDMDLEETFQFNWATKKVKDSKFHIGNKLDKAPAQTLVCNGCGGKKFFVGEGTDYIAIQCIKCKKEVPLHHCGIKV
jgi:hypothetical protein